MPDPFSAIAEGSLTTGAETPQDPFAIAARGKSQDPFSLAATGQAPSSPVEAQEPLGIPEQIVQELGRFGEETALAIPRMFKGAYIGAKEYADLAKTHGLKRANQAVSANVRQSLGIPLSEAQAADRTLQEDLKRYPHVATGLSPESTKAEAHGLVNIASFLPGVGVGARADQLAERAIANPVLARLAAAEMHSIASMVSYEVANAAIDRENLKDAAIRGAAIGAAFPIAGKVAGKVVGKTLQGAMLGSEATGKALGRGIGALSKKAELRSELYAGATDYLRQASQWAGDGLIHAGATTLKKLGLDETLGQLVEARSAMHGQAAIWDTRAREAWSGLRRTQRNLLGRMLVGTPEEAVALAQAEAPKKAADLIERNQRIRAILADVRQKAEDSGVPLTDAQSDELRAFIGREDFGMPRVYTNVSKLLKPGELRDQAMAAFKKRGVSEEEGDRILREMADRAKNIDPEDLGGMRYMGLKGRQYDLPGFNTDPRAVLPGYFYKMAREIENHARFGPLEAAGEVGTPVNKTLGERFPRAFAHLDALPESDRKSTARSIIESQLGAFDKGNLGARIFTKSAQIQVPTKLMHSAITQLTQFFGAHIQHGFRGTLNGMVKLASRDPEAMEAINMSGAYLESLIRDSEQSLGGIGQFGSKALSAVGMTKADRGARIYGGMRGFMESQYAAQQLRKLLDYQSMPGKFKPFMKQEMVRLERKFTELGLDPAKIVEQGGVLTKADMAKAAQTLSTDVNFWSDALSLPHFYKTPWGRVFLQFKSFSDQAARFTKRAVIDPIHDRGDVEPLARALLLTGTSGELVQDVKSLLRGKPRKEQGTDRLIKDLASGSMFGIWADVAQSTNSLDWMYSFMAGPQISDIVKLGYGMGQLGRGNERPLGKQLLGTAIPLITSQVPVAGTVLPMATPAIVNEVYPPKGQ